VGVVFGEYHHIPARVFVLSQLSIHTLLVAVKSCCPDYPSPLSFLYKHVFFLYMNEIFSAGS